MSEEKHAKTIYKYDGKSFDAIEGYSDKQMQNMLASFFPEVANAKLEEKIKDGVRTVSFSKQAGKLGGSLKIAKRILKCKSVEDIMPEVKSLAEEAFGNPLEHNPLSRSRLLSICEEREKKNRRIIERMDSVCPTISADSSLEA